MILIEALLVRAVLLWRCFSLVLQLLVLLVRRVVCLTLTLTLTLMLMVRIVLVAVSVL